MTNGHSNYLKFGQNKSAAGLESDDILFFEEQLFDAKQALFAATTVREIKFLQSKIGYLQKQVLEMQKNDRTKSKKGKVLAKKPKIIRFRPRAML